MSKQLVQPTVTRPEGMKDFPITVLLVDDQKIIGEAVREMLDGEADITLHFCQEPTKAIDMANEVEPTVILQDLVMPDGEEWTFNEFVAFMAQPVEPSVSLPAELLKHVLPDELRRFVLSPTIYRHFCRTRREICQRCDSEETKA